MELTPLRYFRILAQARHMTRAADALGVTQPALSAMLKKLEQEVGTALVVRTSRGVELTEAGRVFLTHADEALRAADQATTSVKELLGLEKGSIRLGGGATAITYLLPPVVSSLRRSYPGLRFYIREAGSSAVAQSVLSGELDLGIVTLPLASVNGSDLERVPMVTDELRLILPPKHRLSGKETFRWKDLDGEPVVAFEAGSAVRDLIDRTASSAGITLHIVMELRSIDSIKQMVAAGIGIGFVSRFALRAGEGLLPKEGKMGRQLAIVKRRDRTLSPAAAACEKLLLNQM
jgi:DNA-binding transcriptional LysR family regulator